MLKRYKKKSSHGADEPGDAPSGVARRTFLRSKNGRLPPWMAGFFLKGTTKNYTNYYEKTDKFINKSKSQRKMTDNLSLVKRL